MGLRVARCSVRLFPDRLAYKQLLSFVDRRPEQLAISFGLQYHPLWVSLMQAEGKRKKRELARCIACIMYSMDARSQYVSQVGSRKKRDSARAQADKRVGAIVGAVKRPRFSFDLVERRAVLDHMQQCMQPGVFYSLPRALAVCRGLSSDFAGGLAVGAVSGQAIVPIKDIEPDGDDGVPVVGVAPQPGNDVFVRVVSARPSALKLVPLAPGDERKHKINRYNMCITFHSAVVSDGLTSVSLDALSAPGSQSALAILATDPSDLSALREGLRSWSADGRVFYRLEGFSCPAEVLDRQWRDALAVLGRFGGGSGAVRGGLGRNHPWKVPRKSKPRRRK